MSNIGFIGAGNMAEALIKGLLVTGEYKKNEISASDISKARLEHLSAEYGIKTLSDNNKLVTQSDILVLAVKPNTVPKVLGEIKRSVNDKKIVVSIAAGLPVSLVAKGLGKKTKIVRVMPNTPALVLEGASVLYCNENLTEADQGVVRKIFEAVGISHIVQDESLLDPVTGLSGSGPAYVSIFIEALSDGGVKMGLPRAMAHELSAQTVYGTAKMIIEGKTHPAEFKDKVSSPSGTTIEGIHKLEEGGFRSSTISAVEAATMRSKELSKEEK